MITNEKRNLFRKVGNLMITNENRNLFRKVGDLMITKEKEIYSEKWEI